MRSTTLLSCMVVGSSFKSSASSSSLAFLTFLAFLDVHVGLLLFRLLFFNLFFLFSKSQHLYSDFDNSSLMVCVSLMYLAILLLLHFNCLLWMMSIYISLHLCFSSTFMTCSLNTCTSQYNNWHSSLLDFNLNSNCFTFNTGKSKSNLEIIVPCNNPCLYSIPSKSTVGGGTRLVSPPLNAVNTVDQSVGETDQFLFQLCLLPLLWLLLQQPTTVLLLLLLLPLCIVLFYLSVVLFPMPCCLWFICQANLFSAFLNSNI